MSQESIENAKAVQEASKAVVKVAETSEKFGAFIAEFTRQSLEAGMGVFADKLKYLRWERQHRLIKRANEFLKLEGFDKPVFALPLKSAIPLIEAASLEEVDELQDLYARLIVVATTNKEVNETFMRSYIDTLERFTPLMASIFDKSYTNYWNSIDSVSKLVDLDSTLPEDVSAAIVFGSFETDKELAWNELDRLGCLRVERKMSGGKLHMESKTTRYGLALFDALKLKPVNEQNL